MLQLLYIFGGVVAVGTAIAVADDLSQLLKFLGLVAALGAAVVAIPKIWQAVKWICLSVYWFVRRIDALSRLVPTIVGMAQEFEHNGNRVLFDAVAEIKKDVAGVKTDVAALKTQTNMQDGVLEGIVARQAEFQTELARLIKHEASGDLHKSKLREEVERKLGPPDAPPIDENSGEI